MSLTVVHPRPLAGQTFTLTPELRMGRDPGPGGAQLVHPTVSRVHAAIHLMMGVVACVADLGSRNGTTVNGRASHLPLPLEAQAVVRLGDVLLVADEATAQPFAADAVLLGRSPKMGQLRDSLAAAASAQAPVLVFGETGTGKERVAYEVHRRSGRQGPFVVLNCAELPPQLVESELFGHERGAFTGAATSKVGLFQAAHGGTLFLDEVGELPLEVQPKLLRAVEQGEIRPVGSNSQRRVDVRVVTATNRDLRALVEGESYRRDLYARLAYFELRLPPLRERRQDILPWIDVFMSQWNAEHGSRTDLTFSPDAAETILLHAWPDNLRGLKRLVHRLASSSPPGALGITALVEAMPELVATRSAIQQAGLDADRRAAAGPTEPPQRGSSYPPTASTNTPRPTRDELLAVYEECGRSVRATAKALGKDRRQIYRWLDSYGIARSEGED